MSAVIVRGEVARYLVPNTDTDTISPAMFLKRTVRTNFEQFVFLEKRYKSTTRCEPSLEKRDFILSNVELNTECSLNHPNSKNGTFLLTWNNFGCGSSRENAVWALRKYRVIIGSAPKGTAAFADIFRDNCRQNLIWTPVISPEDHKALNDYLDVELERSPVTLVLEVESRKLRTADSKLVFDFTIPDHHVVYILEGKTPVQIAKEQIDFYLPAVDAWSKQNQELLAHCPSTEAIAR